MITLSHKIELKPNNKQKTYFRKAFGCARLAYNWGLAEWQRMYKEGEKPSGYTLRKKFNAIKGEEFPFVYEVTKHATDKPFVDLQDAFTRFFKGQCDYPQFKKKKDTSGSFFINGAVIHLSYTNTNSKRFKKMSHNKEQKRHYLIVPRLGCVRMTERLRFDGKICWVTISQECGRFYASFTVTMTEAEYNRTHKHAKREKHGKVGIDMGLKSTLITSDGMGIDNPKFEYKDERRKKRLQRKLAKRVHPRTKAERLQGVKKSNNYRKLERKVNNFTHKVTERRRNFIQKTTTILATTYNEIVLETLNVDGMKRNHKIARSVSDVAWYEIGRQLEYKAELNGGKVVRAERWFASTKTCSQCGNKKDKAPLHMRIYRCDCCGMVMDRDVNAAINLKRIIGVEYSESTPVDLTALRHRFSVNGVATSKVESGKQRTLVGGL